MDRIIGMEVTSYGPGESKLMGCHWTGEYDGEAEIVEISKDVDIIGRCSICSNQPYPHSNKFKYLHEVHIHANVQKIEPGAFAALYLEDMEIDPECPAGVFENGFLLSKDKTVLLCCSSRHNETDLLIPDGITTIESEAFCGLNLKSVTLPDTVTTIKDRAFIRCGIGSINIPDSVTEFGRDVFDYCRPSDISIGEKNAVLVKNDTGIFSRDGKRLVRAIHNYMYTYTVPNGVEEIDACAFFWRDVDSTPLRCVELPESLLSIGDYAFANCHDLQSVKFFSSLRKIGEGAFSGCHALESVELPDSVSEIGKNAFYTCGLKHIRLPKGLSEIKQGTFFNCAELASVELPENLASIGREAFQYCGLEEIKFPKMLLEIREYAFADCEGLRSVVLHRLSSLAAIGDGAFAGCRSLERITYLPYDVISNSKPIPAVFPPSLREIGKSAFAGCDFTHTNIPYTVSVIGENAFDKNVCIEAGQDSCAMWYAKTNGMEYKEDYCAYLD